MPATSAAPALAFSHLGIFVRDIAAMEDFYSRVLGFTVTDRGDLGTVKLVFLSRDPEEHHQIVLASGRPPEPGFNIVNQISFRVADMAGLRRVRAALQGEAVSDVQTVTHGNAISIYFRDPEGYRVEIFFDTPWYCSQPCRVPLDFAKTDAQIMAETEALVRTLPGFKPRAEWVAEMRARMGAPA